MNGYASISVYDYYSIYLYGKVTDSGVSNVILSGLVEVQGALIFEVYAINTGVCYLVKESSTLNISNSHFEVNFPIFPFYFINFL